MASLPTDVANQALDSAGIDFTLGDIEEGTRAAQVCLRHYWTSLRQLLRGAPWAFARREAPLTLVADATGNTPDVGTMVPSGFIYAYLYPGDCARVRYIPWNPYQNPGPPAGNITPSDPKAPLMTNLGQPPYTGRRLQPARYLLTNDANYPPPPGQINWETQGVGQQGRLLICTDVKTARCIYTMTVLEPSVWDHLFRGAMVALLASEIALPLNKDKKFGRELRDDNIAIAKARITEARVADGNEMFASSDISVDWIQARNTGTGGGWPGGYAGLGFGGGDGGFGMWGGGWGGTISLANGSAF